MPNITDLIPEDAITVADTAEYTAWKSQDGSEAWISMKEPNAFVTDAILTSVVERVYLAGGRTEKVTIPDSRGLNGLNKPEIRKTFLFMDLYISDYGTYEVIDLKRNEIEALAEPFIANLKDGIAALGKLFEESGFDNDAGEFLLELARQRFAWEAARNNKAKADALIKAFFKRVGSPADEYSVEFGRLFRRVHDRIDQLSAE